MRCSITRACLTSSMFLATAPLTLGACDKLTPAGTNPTMTLLHDGSEKVCVAPDVQSALRGLLIPKPSELGDNDEADGRAALASISLSYSNTTLESFDKAVSKATCGTTVEIHGASASQHFPLTYTISPSADSAGRFVVVATGDDAKAYASLLLKTALERAEDDQQAQTEAASEQAEHQQLLATINEKWLMGAWINADAPADACGNGQAVWFEPAHVLEGKLGKGRWALSGDQLHIVGSGEQSFDMNLTIVRADPISFEMQRPDGSDASVRRCTRDETETLPQAEGN